jgi:MFS family permease
MPQTPKKVPFQIWIIGVSSLFLTCSAAMFFSVFAIFLSSIGLSIKDISLIDGLVEGLSYFFRIVSGVASDYFSKRKVIFATGAFFITASRIIVCLSMTSFGAILSKVLDRLGNGLQSTPRDALIGDYAPKEDRGFFFGVRQALGTFGSALGTLLVIILFYWNADEFKLVFSIARIPAVLAFLIIIFLVKDSTQHTQRVLVHQKVIVHSKNEIYLKKIALLGRDFWCLMIVVVAFFLSRFSESLIILYGKKAFSLRNDQAIWTMMVYNTVWAISAYFSGAWVDRMRSDFLMYLGITLTLVANIIFITSTNYLVFLLGVIFWGLQIGLMQNIFCTGVVNASPRDLRGTSFGIYYFFTTVSILVANIIGGHLMEYVSEYAFVYGAFVCAISCLAVFLTNIVKKKQGSTSF